MRDYRETSELMERIINKYNRTQNIKRKYGTNEELSRAEIHTINLIGENPEINITKIAKEQGVTKGAVSQMISKLIKKGFIVKSISPNSEAEVRLQLTEEGIIAYKEHRKYHEQSGEIFFSTLRNMSDQEYNEMVKILKEFDELLDKTIKNHL